MKEQTEPMMVWGFGNHESIDMYRRAGVYTTGGVPGNARWLKKWHNFFDSDESAALLQYLGVNIIHSRFYKGMGWEHEKHDFPAVRDFALRCRKRGIKVLGYVQHATLYWEIMQREIPHLRDWAIVREDGNFEIYGSGEYWRWAPCPNNPEFAEYICKILQIALNADCFDGVMFDNVGNYPCYCERCQSAFREFVKKNYDFPFLDPDFIRLPPVPKIGTELQDPLQQAALAFRQETLCDQYKLFRKYIKDRNKDFIISGNYPLVSQQFARHRFGADVVELVKNFDIIVSQTANLVKVENDCVITQVPELKFARAAGIRDLPLTDGCAASLDISEIFLVARLCEALFGGGIVVERSAMRPKRGGETDMQTVEHRKNIIDKVRNIHDSYHALLNAPHYEPIGVLYSENAIDKSYASLEVLLKTQESLMRNHLPFCCVIAEKDGIKKANLAGCTTLIVPGTKLLSDKLVDELKSFAGRLIVVGDECGDYDENFAQRAENPFPDTEKFPVPEHNVLLARFGTRIQWQPDGWKKYFPELPEVELNPESVVDYKLSADDRICGVLITSPVTSRGGSIELPGGNWFAEPFGEAKRPAEYRNGRVIIPAFSGACVVSLEK